MIRSRTRAAFAGVALALVVVGCIGGDGIDVSALEATKRTELKGFVPGSALALSPDGSMLVRTEDDNVCVREIGRSERCAKQSLGSRPMQYSWAADGSAVVFTDNWMHYAHEPDVWLLDVGSMRLRNLTDDGAESSLYRAKSPHIDMFPAVVGDTVRFVRVGAMKDERMQLCSVNVDGGQEECTNDFAWDPGELVAVNWSADAEHLAVLEYGRGDRSRLRLLAADGTEVWAKESEPRADWTQASFSPDGSYVLAVPGFTTHGVSLKNAPSAMVYEVDGGARLDVDAGGAAYFPTWAPEGAALVYAGTVTPDAPENDRAGLWVVSEPGERGQRLSKDPLSPLDPRIGVQWGGSTLFGWDTEREAPVTVTLKQ